jgi:nicotinamide riboside kinase
MRIAISGSHGVGKTTLVDAMGEQLDLPKINEVVRMVAKNMGFGHCEDIRNSDQDVIRLFQQKVFYTQLIAESSSGFLSDRSIFDIVAYMELYGLPVSMIEEYTEFAIRRSNNYDMIIYCPIPKGAGAVDDGFRLTDGQKEYDAILKKLLFQAQCRVIKLPKDRDTWLPRVMNLAPVRKHVKARNIA